MATSLPRRRSALVVACLLFSVIQFVCVYNAGADTYTYNFVNYPAYQTDSATGGTDTVSGTIITDSDSGTLSVSDIVGGSITLTNPVYGPFTFPVHLPGSYGVANLYATPEALTFVADSNPGGIFEFNSFGIGDPSWVNVQYHIDNVTAGELHYRLLGIGLDGPQWGCQYSLPIPGAGDLFVIATATPTPEPATLTLLGSALLGFGVVYVRRRRAKA